MKATVCDICGKKIKSNYLKISGLWVAFHGTYPRDICQDCLMEIQELRRKKEEDESLRNN